MSEIEKIQRYIERTKFPKGKSLSYCMYLNEMDIFQKSMDADMCGTMLLLFEYGRAKGYRAAKAEVRA